MRLGYYGAVMFGDCSKYPQIPEEMKVYCGDNYIVHKNMTESFQNYKFEGANIYHATSSTSSHESFNQIKVKDSLFYKNIDPEFVAMIPTKYKLTFCQKLFSLFNDNDYKILCLFGLKFYFKRKRKS